MEALFRVVANNVALVFELLSVLVLAVGAIEAASGLGLRIRRWSDLGVKKQVWLRFASWITLALELTLAADIIRTAIAPTWNDIGQLAAIALIRTALNVFLDRDMEALASRRLAALGAPGAPADGGGGP